MNWFLEFGSSEQDIIREFKSFLGLWFCPGCQPIYDTSEQQFHQSITEAQLLPTRVIGLKT